MMPKSCLRLPISQLVVEYVVAVGVLLLMFHLVSCYLLLGFCQGSNSRQVHITTPPLPPPPTSSHHPDLMSITRGEILHYCQAESVAVTLAHVTQSLMH